MSKTRHIQQRMSKRAIRGRLVDLALDYGVRHHDGKVVLNQQALVGISRELLDLHQAVQEAVNKGGIVVVSDRETLITTYRLNSFRRSHRPKKGSGNPK